MTKNILILVASLLLLHSLCVQAVPVPKDDDDARFILLFFFIEDFTQLANYTAEQGKILFKKVLADQELLKHKTVELQPHLTNLTNFVAEVERLEKLTGNFDDRFKVIDLTVTFADIMVKYKTSERVKHTPEDVLMEKALQRNGVEELERKFLEQLFKFGEKFNKHIELYFGLLSEEEKTKEAKLIKWYAQFKTEAKIEKKLELLEKFFDFFDMDSLSKSLE